MGDFQGTIKRNLKMRVIKKKHTYSRTEPELENKYEIIQNKYKLDLQLLFKVFINILWILIIVLRRYFFIYSDISSSTEYDGF